VVDPADRVRFERSVASVLSLLAPAAALVRDDTETAAALVARTVPVVDPGELVDAGGVAAGFLLVRHGGLGSGDVGWVAGEFVAEALDRFDAPAGVVAVSCLRAGLTADAAVVPPVGVGDLVWGAVAATWWAVRTTAHCRGWSPVALAEQTLLGVTVAFDGAW
jgi:hypothetical protein